MSSLVKAQVDMTQRPYLISALTDLGYKYTESANAISISRNYHNLVIKEDGNVEYDSADADLVTEIKNHYGKHEMISVFNRLGIVNYSVETVGSRIELNATM